MCVRACQSASYPPVLELMRTGCHVLRHAGLAADTRALQTAMSTFYESGGAQGAAAAGQTSVHDNDDDDDMDADDGDEEMQGLLSGAPGGLSSEPSGSGQTLGGQTLGGGSVPATTSSSSSAAAATPASAPKKKSEIRTTGGRKFGTLGSTIRQQAESDDEADKAQNFYTGGEKR